MNRILLLFFTLLIYGCATKPNHNITSLGYENYHAILSKSSAFTDLKIFLLKNNMKLGAFVVISTSVSSGLANVGIDGQRISYLGQAEGMQYLKGTMLNFVSSEFSGFVQDSESLNLTYCGDFGNAIIGDNGSFGTVEYTYFLSNMTEEQKKIFLKSGLNDCNYDALLGDILYRKKIKVSSNPSTSKLTITRKQEGLPNTSEDDLSLTIGDLSVQAMSAMLTDSDLLQVLKDYKLTGGKKNEPAVVNKIPISDKSETVKNNPVSSVNLEKFKEQCKDLGFKLGTPDYGNCVLQLMK